MNITEITIFKKLYSSWKLWPKMSRIISIFTALFLFVLSGLIPAPDIFGPGTVPLLFYYLGGVCLLVMAGVVIGLLWVGAKAIVDKLEEL